MNKNQKFALVTGATTGIGRESIITPLTKEKIDESVNLILKAELDTKEEIKHHLNNIEAHYVAQVKSKIVGVIGWYQDNVNYAIKAMGDKFPGKEAYWVGFFAVDKDLQGQGIGKALLKKLETELKKKNIKQLWVSSVPKTVSYYKKHGFKVVMNGKINGNPKTFLFKKI